MVSSIASLKTVLETVPPSRSGSGLKETPSSREAGVFFYCPVCSPGQDPQQLEMLSDVYGIPLVYCSIEHTRPRETGLSNFDLLLIFGVPLLVAHWLLSLTNPKSGSGDGDRE